MKIFEVKLRKPASHHLRAGKPSTKSAKNVLLFANIKSRLGLNYTTTDCGFFSSTIIKALKIFEPFVQAPWVWIPIKTTKDNFISIFKSIHNVTLGCNYNLDLRLWLETLAFHGNDDESGTFWLGFGWGQRKTALHSGPEETLGRSQCTWYKSEFLFIRKNVL